MTMHSKYNELTQLKIEASMEKIHHNTIPDYNNQGAALATLEPKANNACTTTGLNI
jgi:hypothetical protein